MLTEQVSEEKISVNNCYSFCKEFPSEKSFNKIFKKKRIVNDFYNVNKVITFYLVTWYEEKKYRVVCNNEKSPFYPIHKKQKTMLELIYYVKRNIPNIIEYMPQDGIKNVFTLLNESGNEYMIVYLILSRRIPNTYLDCIIS